MSRYPRSFLQLVTLGHVVVILPLLALAAYAVWSMDGLVDHYQLVVQNVAESGRLKGEIAEDIRHMELNLRRHEILRNAETLDDYEEARGEWREHVSAFSRLKILEVAQVDELLAQLTSEESAHAAFAQHRRVQALQPVIEDIGRRFDQIALDIDTLIERDQAAMRQRSTDLLGHVMLALAGALLFALLFIWLIRRLIARLIGRFERAVLALGRGDLQTPILLDGTDDLRWLGRWLEWLRKRLFSLEEARANVLRHVSHELKTPLAALQEGSALLAEQIPGPMTPAQLKVLGIVQNNAQRLQALIEGLLRLQQAGHAAERIGYEPLSFTALIEQVVDTHRLIAQERAIVFDLQLAAVDIVAGREALLTIVHNLVSNAVKFSPDRGTVRLCLSRSGDKARLDVIDQGPGVPEKERAHLFEPFYRGSVSRQVPGVGLGLAIAQEFVLAHRGRLEIVDEAAGGAHFRVTLPVAAPHLRKPEND